MSQPKLLIVLRQSPYSSSKAREALDLALVAAAFNQPVSMLFMDDGVYQLVAGQDADLLGMKSLEKVLPMLPMYELENIYAEAASLQQRGVDPTHSPIPLKVLDNDLLRTLFAEHDRVVGF